MNKMADPDTLFPASFLRRLQALDAALLRLRGAAGEGIARKGRVEGRGEFRGHRPYAHGDDLRRLDWNAYGRLGRMFLREFDRERIERLSLLVDRSASMTPGDPPKHVFARRVAAAFGYLALRRGGSVAVVGETAVEGVSRFSRLLDQLRAAGPDGPGLEDCLRAVAGTARAPANLVVVSDCLAPLEALQPLAALSERRARVTLVQTLAPDELEPAAAGPCELHGIEEGVSLALDLDADTVAAYRTELERHLEAVEALARRHGWAFAMTPSDADLTELFVGKLLVTGALP